MKFLFLGILSFFITSTVTAQMFSVGAAEERTGPPTSFLKFGYGTTNFDYNGNPSSPGDGGLEFKNAGTLFAGFSSSSFNLGLSLANRLTGLDDISYIKFTIDYSNRARLISRPSFSLNLPLVFRSGLYTIGETNNLAEDFSQITLSLYPGLEIRNKLGSRITFSNQGTVGYGFSTSNGGFFGGSVRGLSFESKLNIERFIGQRTLGIGYNFDLRDFDIDGSSFDYDLNGHTLSIGLSL